MRDQSSTRRSRKHTHAKKAKSIPGSGDGGKEGIKEMEMEQDEASSRCDWPKGVPRKRPSLRQMYGGPCPMASLAPSLPPSIPPSPR